MARQTRTAHNSSSLVTIFIIVASLYFAQEVIIPFALAVLLTFLLTPATVRLRKWGIPRVPGVIIVVLSTAIVTGAVGWIVSLQLLDLANQLPQFQQNIHEKMQSANLPQGGLLSRANDFLSEVSEEFTPEAAAPEDEAAGQTPTGTVDAPIYTRTAEQATSSIDAMKTMLGSLLGPVATAGIVLVFVVFMLIQREDLRDRLIRMMGPGQLNVTTQALDDAGHRVSRYLLMQLIVNATYGIPFGVGLYFIGVPSPLLWGILATLLRFIPYVGPWIAAAAPLSLAFAVDPGWNMLIMAVILFLTLELISNNIIEPLLYGASTGISVVALLLAALFWTWLWGPMGLLLSTPLTVCLVVLGKYMPQLEFLSIMLGDQPVLSPEARFYQRLLAMDQDEAMELAEKFLEDHSLVELYDTVIIPALHLAEQDRHRGDLDEFRQKFIYQAMSDIVTYLEDHVDMEKAVEGEKRLSAKVEEAKAEGDRERFKEAKKDLPTLVVCLPARDEADELAARMLAQLLQQRKIGARVVSAATLSAERIQEVEREGVQMVCISAVPPFASTHARYLCKSLRSHFPQVNTVVGLWHAAETPKKLQESICNAGGDTVVITLQQAVDRIVPNTIVPAQSIPA